MVVVVVVVVVWGEGLGEASKRQLLTWLRPRHIFTSVMKEDCEFCYSSKCWAQRCLLRSVKSLISIINLFMSPAKWQFFRKCSQNDKNETIKSKDSYRRHINPRFNRWMRLWPGMLICSSTTRSLSLLGTNSKEYTSILLCAATFNAWIWHQYKEYLQKPNSPHGMFPRSSSIGRQQRRGYKE